MASLSSTVGQSPGMKFARRMSQDFVGQDPATDKRLGYFLGKDVPQNAPKPAQPNASTEERMLHDAAVARRQTPYGSTTGESTVPTIIG
jgi:hypothetical protein